MRFSGFLVCLAAAPIMMAAAEPVVLKPSSPWNVHYADNSCRLSRAFGEGEGQILLMLESEAPGQTDMLVLGRPLKTFFEEVPGRFLPVQRKPMRGTTAQSREGSAVLWSRVDLLPEETAAKFRKEDEAGVRKPGVRPPPTSLAEKAQIKAQHLEFAAKITGIEVGRSRPIILETGSMGEAVKAFDKCSRDSLRFWGVDPDVDDKIVRPPWSPTILKWFSADDYPTDMMLKGEQSDVKVRLLVDATGRVTKCTSLSHFKEKSFNDVVCAKFMARAHFQPAELSDGTKVPSYYVRHIVFRLAS